jgi:hypothetical protein
VPDDCQSCDSSDTFLCGRASTRSRSQLPERNTSNSRRRWFAKRLPRRKRRGYIPIVAAAVTRRRPESDYRNRLQIRALGLSEASTGSGNYAPALERGRIASRRSSAFGSSQTCGRGCAYVRAPRYARLDRGATTLRPWSGDVSPAGDRPPSVRPEPAGEAAPTPALPRPATASRHRVQPFPPYAPLAVLREAGGVYFRRAVPAGDHQSGRGEQR